MIPPLQQDTLTFRTAQGVFVLRLVPACDGQVRVSRDGRALSPTLDPGDLTSVVDDVVAHH